MRAGRLPKRLLQTNDAWLANMVVLHPAGGDLIPTLSALIWCAPGRMNFFVLEDNARTPSGVLLHAGKPRDDDGDVPRICSAVSGWKAFPTTRAASRAALRPASRPPLPGGKPTVAVLTPGIYNSAYFEHAFLADQMGAELVEGSDLRVVEGRVQMRTTRGYKPIDVLVSPRRR